MPSSGIHVQLGDYASAFALEIKLGESLGNVLPIPIARGEECRWRFLRQLDIGARQPAGINQAEEIRARTLAIDRVSGVGFSVSAAGRREQRDLSTGGKSDDSHRF